MGKMAEKYLWRDRKRTFLGLPWSFTVYAVDEERFYIKRGFLNIKQDEVRLYRIMDLSLSMNLGQRIFRVGTIKCSSADKSMGDFEIKSVKKPREVMELISELVEKQRDRKRISGREFLHDGGMHDGNYGDDDDELDNDF
ncbi:MAG: PH domain-containing protein [Lachnospiraceae bacterium]|nr:PH domain-containing protein [Lachnospiraceae bacterium]